MEESNEFKSQSVLSVIGLSVITLSIYMTYWLHKQSKVINQRLPEHAIPFGLIVACYALSVVSILWAIPEIITEDSPNIIIIGQIIEKIDIGLYLILLFMVRNRINQINGAEKGQPSWLHGAGTFFLGIYYLQFKINKLTDLVAEEVSISTPGSIPEGSPGETGGMGDSGPGEITPR